MADPGICYCGNYGGGKHTRSARCPDSIEDLRRQIEALQERYLSTGRDKDYWKSEAQRLSAENAGLREDRERLDWIDANLGAFEQMLKEDSSQLESDLRIAIDAARGG